MNITTRIESISPVGFLDMLQAVHVTKLLENCELVGDSWTDKVPAASSGDNPLPEPNTGPKLELSWASDCWGRILDTSYGWSFHMWSIEESGVLAAPVYWDGQQAHLIKATLAPSSTTSLADYWPWVAELKAHCHMLRVTRGVLHICHAGDHDHDPIAMAYELEFTPQEINHLWQLLLSLRKSLPSLRKTYGPLRPQNVPGSSALP